MAAALCLHVCMEIMDALPVCHGLSTAQHTLMLLHSCRLRAAQLCACMMRLHDEAALAIAPLKAGSAQGAPLKHPEQSACVQAEVLLCLEQPEEALALAEQGLHIRSTVLGSSHSSTASALRQLADVLLHLSRCAALQHAGAWANAAWQACAVVALLTVLDRAMKLSCLLHPAHGIAHFLHLF